TGEGMVIGTPSEDLCLAIDTEGDLRIDALGSKSDPCYWEVGVQLLGGETKIDAEFWAVRAE
ncbi:MAG: hypothetical protein VX938_02495, partial [Myxococcota bacterium]|nr:hypothetical protein [Myxococcota bacterium]